jgi:predicted transcriptional regulator
MEMKHLVDFTENDDQFAEILVKTGLKKNYAKVLVYLAKNKNLTSRDIERGTDLRQPEVSIAINHLRKRGWVKISNLLTENKGRPVKLYTLHVSIQDILNEIESEKSEDFQQYIDLLNLARKFIT